MLLRRKKNLFEVFFSDVQVPTTIKLKEEGVKASMALPIKKELFCGFPYIKAKLIKDESEKKSLNEFR